MYIFYDLKLLMLLNIVLGLILPYLINIALLVFYFGCFRKEKGIKSQQKNFRKSHTCLIFVSVMVNDRVIKLAYSQFKNGPALVVEGLLSDIKKRKVLFIMNYISALPSLGMIGCSVFNIIES